MLKECTICKELIECHPLTKYCEECAKLVAKRIAQKGSKTFKEKKKYDSQYNNINHKKPKEEPKSRLDNKSFWKNRDTSCDGSAYF